MADIPQEVREAAAKLAAVSELRPLLLSGEADDHLYIEVCHAMFLAGKRAGRVEGMERAAEIAEKFKREVEGEIVSAKPEGIALAAVKGNASAAKHIAQAIRSENDGHC